MAIGYISQSYLNNTLLTDESFVIGVGKPPSKALSPREILRQAVMFALETKDVAKADGFIKQSGLTPPAAVPVKNVGGQEIYQLSVDESFYAKIEDFKNQKLKFKPSPQAIPIRPPICQSEIRTKTICETITTRENSCKKHFRPSRFRLVSARRIEIICRRRN